MWAGARWAIAPRPIRTQRQLAFAIDGRPALMAEMGGAHDGMEGDTMPHDEEMTDLHSVVLEPGETIEITHTFESAGQLMVGCHEPGHWEAGMKMEIDVA